MIHIICFRWCAVCGVYTCGNGHVSLFCFLGDISDGPFWIFRFELTLSLLCKWFLFLDALLLLHLPQINASVVSLLVPLHHSRSLKKTWKIGHCPLPLFFVATYSYRAQSLKNVTSALSPTPVVWKPKWRINCCLFHKQEHQHSHEPTDVWMNLISSSCQFACSICMHERSNSAIPVFITKLAPAMSINTV